MRMQDVTYQCGDCNATTTYSVFSVRGKPELPENPRCNVCGRQYDLTLLDTGTPKEYDPADKYIQQTYRRK